MISLQRGTRQAARYLAETGHVTNRLPQRLLDLNYALARVRFDLVHTRHDHAGKVIE
jgi:hypothetical protein